MGSIKTYVDNPRDAAVARTIAGTLNRSDAKQVDELNHTVERMGETVLLMQSYLVYRLEGMWTKLDGKNSSFTQQLSNRTNHIIRACEDFEKVMNKYVEGEEKRKAYSWFSDVVFRALDSLLDDMHRDYPEPTAQVVRRAKLRYHDPYMEHVKECTAAFEDGYCKGYIDAMEDFIREVASLSDNDKIKVHVVMNEGKIKLSPA